MAGSLWRQKIGTVRPRASAPPPASRSSSPRASYDYQPDWSPDGRWVIYSSYRNDAMELWILDLASGVAKPLLANGAVNVEPRFSPDGRRIVFVSTLYNKRFHIFTADISEGRLIEHRAPDRRAQERAAALLLQSLTITRSIRCGRATAATSSMCRIEITSTAPAGSGARRRDAAPAARTLAAGAAAHEIHYEETNWKARPDVSPDGSRLVYSSYLGRSWHNLWVMPAGGGDAFPIGYGDWDQTYPRWSPDGTRVAFISNQSGNTDIGIVRIPGGVAETWRSASGATCRRWRACISNIKDSQGRAASARVSITDAAGRFYAPAGRLDQCGRFVRSAERHVEAHYFHAHGEEWIDVPAGVVNVEILHGFERRFERRQVTTTAGQIATLAVNLDEGTWSVPDAAHWVSADVHVHMNYGGEYRNTPAHLVTAGASRELRS